MSGITYKSQLRRPYFPGHRSSYLDLIPEEDDEYNDISREELEAYARLADIDAKNDPSAGSRVHRKSSSSSNRTYSMTSELDQMAAAKEEDLKAVQSNDSDDALKYAPNGETPNGLGVANDYLSAGGSASGMSTPTTPSMNPFDSYGGDAFPPVDRLTMFDILENLALPQRLERMQNAIHDNAEKLRRQRQKLTTRAISSKNIVVDEWRKRVKPGPDQRLDKYRKRMRHSVDRMSKRWNDAKTVTLMEKVSFVTATLNILITAYMIGAFPQYFHYWYSLQLAYFMPLRWYKYHQIGFHYFLADLCYFVNFLLVLSIWVFPQSKRLLISTYCLAFGNNAVAIAMWRNSLVFHSLDKTTTLFIHIMPCCTLHVLVHLIPEAMQKARFPAIHTIKYSPPDAPEHYNLSDMIIWATLPYAIWQLSYHFLITVRKRSKIAAGRPTSFTWLRRSYRGNVLGKFVLSFPDAYQETVFMAIQYCYALLTMTPCPIWFRSSFASAGFMFLVFAWASWNGATFYIDVFGRRMEKELEALRKEVARMAKSPDINGTEGSVGTFSPLGSPSGPGGVEGEKGMTTALDLGPAAQSPETPGVVGFHQRGKSIDSIPLLDRDDALTATTTRSEFENGQEPVMTVDGGVAPMKETVSGKGGEQEKVNGYTAPATTDAPAAATTTITPTTTTTWLETKKTA